MTRFLLASLEEASREWPGGQATGAMLSATRAFLAGVEQNPPLLAELAALLRETSPGAAAWLAVTGGTAVERGASPEVLAPAVMELLRSWLPKLPAWVEDPDAAPPPTAAEEAHLELFPFICQSAVTHLARLPALRDSLGRDAALLERLDQVAAYTRSAAWVYEALTKSSGELVFLHPRSESGLRLRYENVSNNFHLFTLLQTAVGTTIEGGLTPDPVIAKVARGKSSEAVTVEAWWHYGPATSPTPSLEASVWGEGLVRDISIVEGERVLLAWPTILQSRHWDVGFLQPHLEAMPADLVVERALSPGEVVAWLDRLGIARVKRKNYWWWPSN